MNLLDITLIISIIVLLVMVYLRLKDINKNL